LPELAPPYHHHDPIGGEIERCFRQNNILTLATLLCSELGTSHGVNIEPSARWAEVSGILNLSHDNISTPALARCKFKIGSSWVAAPPRVKCLEPWVRLEADWHAGIGINCDEICYVLDEEWRDAVSKVYTEQGIASAARYAAEFCLQNVKWLLYRHYIGFVAKTKSWPKDWPGRPHGDEAYKQYRLEKFPAGNDI
jgi:hypothetical protein